MHGTHNLLIDFTHTHTHTHTHAHTHAHTPKASVHTGIIGLQTVLGVYLAGSDYEPVLVLVLEVFGVVQLLPADAHGHRAQLLIRPEVV